MCLDKWLEWVPQLLAGLGSKEARVFHTILQTIGRVHPQALYFPIRNVYLTVRVCNKIGDNLQLSAYITYLYNLQLYNLQLYNLQLYNLLI